MSQHHPFGPSFYTSLTSDLMSIQWGPAKVLPLGPCTHRRTGRSFTVERKKLALKITLFPKKQTICPETNFFSVIRTEPETSCESVLYSWIRL